MLRRSARKRSLPPGRGDFVAAAARKNVVTPSATQTAVESVVQPDSSNVPTSSTSTAVTDTSIGPVEHQSLGNVMNSGTNPVPCTKASDDLARNVSSNLKQKIISGEYLDLSLLLVNSQAAAAENQKLVFVNGEILVQQKQQNKILSIESWTDAFIIYSSIYCRAHPDNYIDMLKYMHTIRLAAKRSTNGWKFYDEQFRLRKSQDPSSSWALIDQELWLLYLYSTPTVSNSPVVRGYKCYTYNYQGNCHNLPCLYTHAYIRCNEQHSIITCPRQDINPNRHGDVQFRPQILATRFRPRLQSNTPPRFNSSTRPRFNLRQFPSGTRY